MERKGLRSARVRTVLALATLAVGALFALPAQALSAGQTEFADANNDGYVNAAEAAALDSGPSVPVNWLSPGADYEDALDTTFGSFVDAGNNTPTGCGPFGLTPSGTGTGWLNSGCFAGFADGDTITWVVEWTDNDDSLAAVTASDTIVKDITAPIASITLAAGADNKITQPEAAAGAPVTWSVSETGPTVTVRAANDGQPSPAACTWAGSPRAATGAVTSACFAALSQGNIDVIVEGTDDAGNTAVASDPNAALVLDTVGHAAPIVQILTDPINSSNVGAVAIKITGVVGAPYALTVDDVPAGGTVVSSSGAIPAGGVVNASVALGTLADGVITASATQQDADLNWSVAGTDTALKDTAAPGTAPVMFSPAAGSLNSALPLKASGSSEPGSTVEIWVDKGLQPAIKAATTLTNGAGAWTVVLPTRTADKGFGSSGTYSIKARQIDSNGNPGGFGPLRTFDLDIDLPLAVIDAPANQSIYDHDDTIVISGTAADTNGQSFAKLFAVELDVFSPVTPDLNAQVVPNTAEPAKTTYRYQIAVGKSVFKHNATCKGTDVALTPCGLSGPNEATWSYDLSFLPPGPYTVQVRALDIAGNWSAQYATVNFIKL